MIKKSSLFAIILILGAVIASAQTAPATDVVMVLPFENTSGKGEFNWVGESFADSLSDLLRMPTPVSYTHLDVYKRQVVGITEPSKR